LYLLALAGFIAVLAAVVVLSPPRVTLDQFDCLRTGMSRAEVEVILGPPAVTEFRWPDGTPGVVIWNGGPAGDACVTFNRGGRVQDYGWRGGRDRGEGMFGGGVRWARLQWHRWFP
jgi:hypothetical protein